MQNPATRSRDELNVFTDLVDIYGKQDWADRRNLWVRLRDGTLVRPVVFLGEDDWADDFNKPRGFKTDDWKYCWNLDGTSVTRPDYDMMEIVYV